MSSFDAPMLPAQPRHETATRYRSLPLTHTERAVCRRIQMNVKCDPVAEWARPTNRRRRRWTLPTLRGINSLTAAASRLCVGRFN